MKKNHLLLLVVLLFSVGLLAQTPENRTVKTTIIDALAQLPAKRSSDYNKIIKEISSTGEEGILLLSGMMSPVGKGQNAPIEYALNGLSHYVSAEGHENERLVTAQAYLKALERATDDDIKAFIIRQLEIIGNDETVTELSIYLTHQQLSAPAAQALAAIGGQRAGDVLLTALSDVKDENSKADIIQALAFIGESKAELPLLEMLEGSNGNLRKTILDALGKTGSERSLAVLVTASEQAGFTMDKESATDAYIMLIKRILSQGDLKTAEKAAIDLQKKATKKGQIQTRSAALQIQMAAKPDDAVKLLKNALKDKNREYRNMALDHSIVYADIPMYDMLIKELPEAPIDKKADIVGWFLRLSNSPDKRERAFDRVFHSLLPLLSNPDYEVKSAVVWVLVKSKNSKVIAPLVNLLTEDDEKTVELAKNALASFDGDITNQLERILPQTSDKGHIAALELFGLRKSTKNLNDVLLQIQNGSPEVRTVALTVLKDVVEEKDLPTLYSLLENGDIASTAPVQQAIIAAISEQSRGNKIKTITERMSQAIAPKQSLYYMILASTGDAKALTIISDGFGSENKSTKDMAFNALLSWKGLDAAEKLYNICVDNASSAYFDKALKRYTELASDPVLTGEARRLLLDKALKISKTDYQKNYILKSIGQTNTYLGLILAGEYLDEKAVQQAAANAVMTIALANQDFTGEAVKKLLTKTAEVLDNPDAEYQKQAIRKHLAEMPLETGFVAIFNGKDLSGWKGLVGNPISRDKMKPAQLEKEQIIANEQMHRDWKVEGESIVYFGSGYNNLCTKKQYGDFEMYIDWMLDPNGNEPDGGIYLRGTPQVQIWDISRTEVGAQVGSGGLYNNLINASTPMRVADNKLGEWNTFYIKMVGDRVTVKLNGEIVVNNVILENYWDRSLPVPIVEQLELQAHGSKVYYRNIYVKELERMEPFKLSVEEEKEGFKVLFDGTNMHQWTGNTVDYILENGCISMHPSSRFGGNLYTKDEYDNFVFRFEFQLTPGANNGLGIRAEKEKDAAYYGMEIQILDHDAPIYKNITPFQVHGSVYGIIAAKRAKLKPIGEWNYEEVIADGNRIKVILNGEVIVDGDIKEAVRNGNPDKKEHPGLFNKKGYIGFLGHGSPVKFRNIRIKEL